MPQLLPARGRSGLVVLLSVDRHLTAADFANRAVSPGHKLGPAIVQKLHARHHRAAQLLAEGKTVQQVAIMTDYTPQRISDLQSTDPAFKDLVARYQLAIGEANVDAASAMQGKLLDVGSLAVDEIRDRLEDDTKRKEIPVGELRQLAQFATDRTVAPPKTAIPGQSIPTRITFKIGTRDLRPQDPTDITIDADINTGPGDTNDPQDP